MVLRFPAEIAVGELWWQDDRTPGGWSHQLAIGELDVPDGTTVRLTAGRDYHEDGPAVDLEFIRGLPADGVAELNLTGDFIPASFAALAHLAPGLRALSVFIDELGPEAPSVIAELTADHATIAPIRCPLGPGPGSFATPIVPGQRALFIHRAHCGPVSQWIED